MLSTIFKWLKSIKLVTSDREIIEDYLSKSTSLEDLERRQRELRNRGFFV